MKHRETPKHNLIYKNLSNFRKAKKLSYEDIKRIKPKRYNNA